MDYKNVTIQGSVGENECYKIVVTAEMDDCYVFQNAVLITLKERHQDYNLQKIAIQFMGILLKTIIGLGSRVFMLSKKNGKSGENLVISSSKPQHRIMLDSLTYESCGTFKPLPEPFSTKQQPESSVIRKHLNLMSEYYTDAFAAWRRDENVDVHVAVQSQIFALQGATEFATQDCRRSWIVERTILRQVVQEFETQMCGRKRRYKGVRWRPERKHPWVAEIMLAKKKKLWIGSFETQEEAAHAFDVAAIYHGKQTMLNF